MHQESRPLVRVYETLCAVHYLLYCGGYTAYCSPRLIKGQLRHDCTMALCANDTAMLDLEPDTEGFPLKVLQLKLVCFARLHKYGSFQFKLQLKGGNVFPVPCQTKQNKMEAAASGVTSVRVL